MYGREYVSIRDQTRRIGDSVDRYVPMSRMPHDDSHPRRNRRRERFDRPITGGGKSFSQQQIFGGISGDNQFRTDHQIRSERYRLLRRFEN